MLDETGAISIRRDIVFRQEEEGAFLFDPDTGRICYLNELGVNMWKSFEESKAPEQLISEISLDFPEIPKEQIARDCKRFIGDLGRLGFLTSGTEK